MKEKKGGAILFIYLLLLFFFAHKNSPLKNTIKIKNKK
jgi:hypothetical protein